MPVLHNLERVTLEVDLSIKVLLVKGFHGDLVTSIVFFTVFLTVKGQVVLDWLAGKLGLFVLAGRKDGVCSPEGSEEGDGGEQAEEDRRLEATTKLPGEIPRDQGKKGEEGNVGEALAASSISWEWRVFDRRVLFPRTTVSSTWSFHGQIPLLQLCTSCVEGALTSVVLTPQSGAAASERGAGGVSTNSNDSSDGALSRSAMINASN
jgi:hypothetical protein